MTAGVLLIKEGQRCLAGMVDFAQARRRRAAPVRASAHPLPYAQLRNEHEISTEVADSGVRSSAAVAQAESEVPIGARLT